MKDAYVMVGLPGVGKSTFLKTLKGDYFVYSTDRYIEQYSKDTGKSYGEVFQRYFKSAKQEADRDLIFAIKSGQTIVYDQTNLSRAKRKQTVEHLKKIDPKYRAICIYISESSYHTPQTWSQMRAYRKTIGRDVPDHVYADMRDRLEVPDSSEKYFDSIRMV